MDKLKKVLIIANNGMGNSGVPNVIAQVIESQQHYCKFSIVVFNDDDYYYPFLKEHNVGIIKMKEVTPKNIILKLFWYFFRRPRYFYKKTKMLLKNRKYDAIHSFKEEEGWPFLKAAWKAGVQTRITHCNNEFKKRNSFLSNYLANWNLRKMNKYANVFVGVCKMCCETMFPKKPYQVIYNSYNEQKYNLKVDNKLKNELVLTQVATFSNRKNQLFTIEVINSLKEIGINCKTKLVGFPIQESYYLDMLSLIDKYKLSDCIEIIDGRNGIGDIFEKTTFLLLPSISEAAPIVLVEAQACGIMCFASNTITNEMNCGGVNYLPINEGPTIWAQEIKKQFENKCNNRNRFDLQRFSKTEFQKKISELYC